MDLTWPEDLEDYRTDVRTWLRENLRGRTFPSLRRHDTIGPLRDWERALHTAGYAAVHWPVEYGGGGLNTLQSTVFFEEYARSGAPRRLNRQAMSLAGPTLMAAGTPDQKTRWLPRMVTCDDLWCQGFSEPEAGSDLASLRTAAHRTGDNYVVNGQKIWSSNAPISSWMFALVRTNTEVPKHRGITYLMIDLNSPGVEIRPIRQIDGLGDFAEVFLTDVTVPIANRIGQEDEGWRIAMTTLQIERGLGVANAAEMDAIVVDLERLFDASGIRDDAALVGELSRLKAQVQRYRLNAYAVLTSDRKETVDTLGAVHKLEWSNLQLALYELGMRALGARVELGDEGLPVGVNKWHERYWLARASRIYSGTNEIQKNIIAERLLGLPKDPVR